MSAFNEQFMSHVNIATYAITSMDTDTKNNILTKYDILASSDNADLQQNMSNYEVLMNKTLFMSTVMSTNAAELERFSNLITLLRRSIANTTSNKYDYKAVYNRLASKLDGNGAGISNTVTTDDINVALNTFGLEIAEDIDTDEELSNLDLSGIDELDVFDEEDEPLIEIAGEAADIDAMDAIDLVDANAPDIDIEESPIEIADEADDLLDNEEEINSKDRKELEKAIASKFEVQINKVTDDILGVLSALYESGFSAMPQAGLFVNNGDDSSPLISLGAGTKSEFCAQSRTDGGSIYDYKVMKVISRLMPALSTYAVTKGDDAIPDITSLFDNNYVCHKLHLQFQSANIKFCTGRTSIRRWITDTQLKDSTYKNADEWIAGENKGKTVLRSYKSMIKPWYRWCVKRLIVDSFIDAGVRSFKDEELASKVLETISRNIRNVIVASERDPGEKVEIKISYYNRIDVDNLINKLEDELNIGGSTSIKINQISKDNYERHGVLTLSIIYDEAKANKSNLYAGDIVEKLIDSGNAPSWDHALLGKKKDGTYFFWDDFMNSSKNNPEKRCYTIYAGSRSGKGIMTSTLIASALCDKKQVFYTDGKPENGAALGEIAWSRGYEAYSFNGTASGKAPYSGSFEQYTYGKRTSSEIADYLSKLPKELFENTTFFTNDAQEEFLGVMRYLKSLSLCASVIEARAASKLPVDNWQIWVFDEMTAMSRIEKSVREAFSKYMNSKGVKIDLTLSTAKLNQIKGFTSKVTPGSSDYDAGIEYIYKWQTWNENIRKAILNASVISLGKASLNLIFIFQEPSWLTPPSKLSPDGMGGITTIANIAKSLKSTKIAGNKAIPRNAGEAAGEYGDATMHQDWIEEINEGTGWWVISHSSNIKSAEVTLFKPFNVYTTPIGPGDVKLDAIPADMKPEYYIEGYVSKLLGAFGIDPGQLLQTSFDYANNAVNTLGFASSVKEFLYDCTNFAFTGGDASYSNVLNRLTNNPNSEPVVSSTNQLNIGEESSIGDTANSTVQVGVSNESAPALNSEDAFLRQVQQQRAEAEQMKTLKFMRTTVLIRANLSDNVLATYINKFIWNRARQNNFNYSDRSNTVTSTNLSGAAIIYSTLHYAGVNRGIVDLDIIKNEFIQNINSNNDPNHKAKLALGMLSAYDANTLQYDQLPSQDIMRQWISEYNQIVDNTINTMDIPYTVGTDTQGEQFIQDVQNSRPIDVWSPDFEEEFINYGTAEPTREEILRDGARTVNVEQFNPNIFYSNINGVRQFTPKVTQNVTVLNPSTFREVEMKSYKTTERFKKRLFESKNGTAYIFKKYWDAILDESAKLVGNRSRVTKMAVMGNQLTINGMIVDISRLLDETYGLTLNNLFHIKSTFKKFPMLQQLILDSDASSHLIFEYGDNANAVWKMFQDNRALQTVTIIGYDGNAVNYNRRDFAATANVLNNQLSIKKFSMEAEQAVAQKNPRLHSKPVGYMYGVFNNGKTLSGNSFKKAGKYFTDKDPKLLRAMGWSTVGIAAIGVGSIIGLAGGIVDLFTPKE